MAATSGVFLLHRTGSVRGLIASTVPRDSCGTVEFSYFAIVKKWIFSNTSTLSSAPPSQLPMALLFLSPVQAPVRLKRLPRESRILFQPAALRRMRCWR